MTIAGHTLLAVSFSQAFHYKNALWSKRFLPCLTFGMLTADNVKRCTETVQAVTGESFNMVVVCKSDIWELFRHFPCWMQPDSLYFKESISHLSFPCIAWQRAGHACYFGMCICAISMRLYLLWMSIYICTHTRTHNICTFFFFFYCSGACPWCGCHW